MPTFAVNLCEAPVVVALPIEAWKTLGNFPFIRSLLVDYRGTCFVNLNSYRMIGLLGISNLVVIHLAFLGSSATLVIWTPPFET